MNWTTRTAVSVALACAGSAGVADEPAVKILARGAWPHLPTHSSAGIGTDRAPLTRVIRSEEDLAKAAGGGARITVAKEFKVTAIDFAKHMILAVEDGTQPMVGVSGGGPPSALYAVAVARIDRDDAAKTMTVHWRRVPRAKDQVVLTRPLEAVLVDRFDGEVKFNRLPPSDQPGKDPPAVGKAVAPAARAFWPDGWPPEVPRKEWFVRDAADLIDSRLRAPEPVLERMRAEAKAKYEKALKVEDIDFTQQMVVGVSGGVQSAGVRIEVTRVAVDRTGKTMTVFWRLSPPPKDKPPPGIAHPAEVILLDRFTGDIRFREEVTKKE